MSAHDANESRPIWTQPEAHPEWEEFEAAAFREWSALPPQQRDDVLARMRAVLDAVRGSDENHRAREADIGSHLPPNFMDRF